MKFIKCEMKHPASSITWTNEGKLNDRNGEVEDH